MFGLGGVEVEGGRGEHGVVGGGDVIKGGVGGEGCGMHWRGTGNRLCHSDYICAKKTRQCFIYLNISLRLYLHQKKTRQCFKHKS